MIQMVSYKEGINDQYVDKIALFNDAYLTQEQAIKCLEAGEYNPSIVIMTELQYQSIIPQFVEDIKQQIESNKELS